MTSIAEDMEKIMLYAKAHSKASVADLIHYANVPMSRARKACDALQDAGVFTVEKDGRVVLS